MEQKQKRRQANALPMIDDTYHVVIAPTLEQALAPHATIGVRLGYCIRRFYGGVTKQACRELAASEASLYKYMGGRMPRSRTLLALSRSGISADWILTGCADMFTHTTAGHALCRRWIRLEGGHVEQKESAHTETQRTRRKNARHETPLSV